MNTFSVGDRVDTGVQQNPSNTKLCHNRTKINP